MLNTAQLRQHIQTTLAAYMLTPPPATEPEPVQESVLTVTEPEPIRRPCSKTLPELVTEFSAWETELWGRYGRVFYPQTAAGKEVFRRQGLRYKEEC